MNVSLSKKSWHYKLNRLFLDDYDLRQKSNFCAYFWTTILCLLGIYVVMPFRQVAKLTKIIKRKVDDWELANATQQDIYASMYAYNGSSAIDKKQITRLFGIWYKRNIYGTINSSLSTEDTAIQFLPAAKRDASIPYTKGYKYRFMREFASVALNGLTVIIFLLPLLLLIIFKKQEINFNLFLGVLNISVTLILGCILSISIINLIDVAGTQWSYQHRIARLKPEDQSKKKEPKKTRDNPFKFFITGFKAFKEKTCHKIEWVDQ